VSGLVLRVVRGAGRGRDIAVAGELVIGREAAGDGRLDGEPALSRRHARIVRAADGSLTIEDLGSLNGTHVNGRRITAATPLRAGDELRLGETVMALVDAGDAARPRPPAGSDATVIADLPPLTQRPRPRRPPPQLDLRALADHPLARYGAGAAVALVVLVVWLVARGGGSDPADVLADGRRSTVQLVVAPSPVVRALASAAPGTAPPRSGSGIVVDARRGLVLTADRLVAGASRISGRFGGGRSRRATLVARAPCDGVALVRLPGLPDGVQAADIGAAGGLGRGDRVVALGYPGSLVGSGRLRSSGLRSARGRVASIRRRPARLDPADPRLSGLIVHTARIGPGGAGGPLVDGDGKVVGLGLVAPDRSRLREALAMERAQGLYGDLATARTESDAGWRLEPWSEIRGRASAGLLVTGVDAGGPASRVRRRSALRPFDPLLGATIFAVNGRTVNDVADVCRALAGVRRGRRVRVRADVATRTVTTRGVRRPSRARAVQLVIGL
jgi:S1-C subfamily serine protease